MRLRVLLLGLAIPVTLFAQAEQPLPRFRAGANLVRVDAYVSKDGAAVTDLTAADFAVFEDDKPQAIESFELIQARGPIPQSQRINPTNVRDMQQETGDSARVFTLFFDQFLTSLSGSYNARRPIIETLDQVIGADDLIGAMTPGMSPGAITYSRKTTSIEQFVTQHWHWGEKGRDNTLNTRDPAIRGCGWDSKSPMLAKYREQQTLDALTALVEHLDALRPERKFVMVFTEGWPLYRADERLAPKSPPITDRPTTDPRTGGLRRPETLDPGSDFRSTSSCERLQSMLAFADHEVEFRQLLQRANRANVSFYPIDARGLVVFDDPTNFDVPPSVDAAWLRERYNHLRDMASATDGEAVLDTADVSKAMRKVFADVGSYYLLGYYSTNQRLDGRFRRIRVEVKRDDVEVRSRPGYLAPTEAEARAAGAAINRAGEKAGPPATVTRALDAIAPARGNMPARVQAVGGRGNIHAIVELDAATAKQAEWMSGGTLKLTFEPDRAPGTSSAGSAQTITVPIDSGQRSIVVNGAERPLAPGRYAVRAELTARGGRLPIQVTTFATVPAEGLQVGSGALASRRGPSTGLAYVPTADPRFRRTERLRMEVPLAGEEFAGTGRVLTREGQPMPLVVSYSTRTDAASKQLFAVADVALAPLAAGEYVLELSLTKDGRTDTVSYGFRIIP
ncbi:MAG TPA: VWA domain-containing protein [Vicinamibacterales bacterium]|nr:VWA domain-containing protein [Vicinamibacterales bacterium]